MAEHLANGWEADAPDDDNLARAAIRNVSDRLAFTAQRMGGEFREWDDLCALRVPAINSMWVNVALVLSPVDTGRPDVLAERLDAFYGDGAPATIFSPLPTPDLRGSGYIPMGHPPLMVRPAGGETPALPSGLSVEEVTTPEALAEWEQTLAEGFPLDAPGKFETGSLFDARTLGGPLHFFLARLDGRPVAAAGAFVSRGVCQVEFVATLSEHRGKRFGEAVTWAATMTAPELPAVLIASDLGRPVYERMGYLAVFRYTGWIRPGA